MSTRTPTERTVILLCDFPGCTAVDSVSAVRWYDEYEENPSLAIEGWQHGGQIVGESNGYFYTDADDLAFCPGHDVHHDSVFDEPGWTQPTTPYLMADDERAYLITADQVADVERAIEYHAARS